MLKLPKVINYDDDDDDDDLEDDDDDMEDENDDDDNVALTMMTTWITLTSLIYSLSQMSVRIVRKLGSMWSFSRRKSARRFSEMLMWMMMCAFIMIILMVMNGGKEW